MKELDTLIERLEKIGIDMKVSGNFPWIYIDSINGKRVTEKFQANHGFTIGWYPITPTGDFKFSDVAEIFKLIRKYTRINNKS